MTQQNQKPKYWRSLEQLNNSPEFEQFLKREFPEAAEEAPTGVSRRRWMQLMGASLALTTGAAGCRYPEEEVVGFRYPEEQIAPFSRRPEGRIPGATEKFATTLIAAGKVCPVVATSYDGRPIKIDGNQEHPLVSGADTFAQASILQLYDPDRSQTPVKYDEGMAKTWEEFTSWWNDQAKSLEGAGSAKLAILHQTNASPSVLEQMNQLAKRFPEAKWYQYDSISSDGTLATEVAFGKALRPQLRVEQADIIVDLGADLLGTHITHGYNSLEFGKRRTPETGDMNRLYVVESRFSVTGIAADHRLAVAASQMNSFVADLEQAIDAALENGETKEAPEDKVEKLLAAMVNDLVSHKGKSMIVGGTYLDDDTLVRIWRINNKLENLGKTIEFIDVPELSRENIGTIEELTTALSGGSVSTLLVLGGNPIYDAPADLDFVGALDAAKAKSVYFGDYQNETSKRCTWHLPASHGLEQWGDAIAYDGSYCITQPLISPIFDSKDPIQFLSLLAGSPVTETLEAVRQTISGSYASNTTEAAWTKAVHDGFIAGSASSPVEATFAESLNLGDVDFTAWKAGLGEGLELMFHAGAATYDGTYANNGWLQELPDPLTKVTWDNVVTVSRKTAEDNNLKQGELLAITANDTTVELPVYIQLNQSHGTLAVGLGYGRTQAGMVGGKVDDGIPTVGVDVGPLRTKDTMHLTTGVTIQGTGKMFPLATTQDHFSIDTLGMEEIGRRVGQLVREGTLEQYEEHPNFAEHVVHHPPLESLWELPSYDNHAWGMSIDLSKCTGCNACTIACQSENNIPIVGKEAVSVGREMHWIRVDRYFSFGDGVDPETTPEEDVHSVTQPVTCMQCETAPCESVCPVAATVHSNEGLNDMVYNRCIGTRYCGNNCPYKVRRFNYLDWRAEDYRFETANRELAKLIFNPEVTVRNRGVMEKCTYCVQRIQNTKIEARAERRPIGANEIKTACQEACSSQAIEFGDLNNEESSVAKAHANPRAYAMLVELNTKPRTRYLAKIRNPHPWLAPEIPQGHGGHGGEEHGHEHGEDEHAHPTSEHAEGEKAEEHPMEKAEEKH
ncbi:4Fe-4S dicluster domain-containing protein [Bremerella cremea]|uniref:Molybdopterin oxidoreductase n=1 Tax=Blastopirellula marina TaxID=124 RepID=A0A2S8FBB5_9BACT|nr:MULTISPECIES: TAT-variant-translocated molybdopterin oxidoreductase [Pirellulaceae]PQO29437.1 molybdopterin oxidoreductase [Blastopirellula marina]RCS42741.1 4Fe-4S dicluster domain-containing protein [Bremerella cremea]